MTTDAHWGIRILVGAVVGALLFGLVPAISKWIGERESRDHHPQDQVNATIPTPLLAAQIDELKAVNELVCGKEEYELDKVFDLDRLARFNARLMANWTIPGIIPADQMAETDAFFKGGQGQISLKYVKPVVTRNGVEIREDNPRARLNLTPKYVANLALLKKYEMSAILPEDVREALKELDVLVNDDTSLIFDVANDLYNADPDDLYYNEYVNSPHFGVFTSEYARRFKPLKPSADKVATAIRKYLQIN